MADFKRVFDVCNSVNCKIGFYWLTMLMTMFLPMNCDDGLHYCCSVWLLRILITTVISIPSHLLVVPHAKRLVKNVMVISGEIYRIILEPCSRLRCCWGAWCCQRAQYQGSMPEAVSPWKMVLGYIGKISGKIHNGKKVKAGTLAR